MERSALLLLALATACGGGDEAKRERPADRGLGDPKLDLAKVRVDKIAGDWFDRWAHDGATCPGSLDELARAVNATSGDLDDPWGKRYRFACAGAPALPSAVRFGVISDGPDGVPDTADDVKSWQRLRAR